MLPRPGVLPVYAQHAQAILKTVQRLEETSWRLEDHASWYMEMSVLQINTMHIEIDHVYVYIYTYIYNIYI